MGEEKLFKWSEVGCGSTPIIPVLAEWMGNDGEPESVVCRGLLWTPGKGSLSSDCCVVTIKY